MRLLSLYLLCNACCLALYSAHGSPTALDQTSFIAPPTSTCATAEPELVSCHTPQSGVERAAISTSTLFFQPRAVALPRIHSNIWMPGFYVVHTRFPGLVEELSRPDSFSISNTRSEAATIIPVAIGLKNGIHLRETELEMTASSTGTPPRWTALSELVRHGGTPPSIFSPYLIPFKKITNVSSGDPNAIMAKIHACYHNNDTRSGNETARELSISKIMAKKYCEQLKAMDINYNTASGKEADWPQIDLTGEVGGMALGLTVRFDVARKFCEYAFQEMISNGTKTNYSMPTTSTSRPPWATSTRTPSSNFNLSTSKTVPSFVLETSYLIDSVSSPRNTPWTTVTFTSDPTSLDTQGSSPSPAPKTTTTLPSTSISTSLPSGMLSMIVKTHEYLTHSTPTTPSSSTQAFDSASTQALGENNAVHGKPGLSSLPKGQTTTSTSTMSDATDRFDIFIPLSSLNSFFPGMASYISAHLSDRAERKRVLPDTGTALTTPTLSPQTLTLNTTFPRLTALDNRPPRPVPVQPQPPADTNTKTDTDVHQRQHETQTCTFPHSLKTLTTTIELPTRSGFHLAGDPLYVGSVTLTTTMTLPIPSSGSDQQAGCVAILSGQQKNAAVGSGQGKGPVTVAFVWVTPFLWGFVGVMGVVNLL